SCDSPTRLPGPPQARGTSPGSAAGPARTVALDRHVDAGAVLHHLEGLQAPAILLAVRVALVTTRTADLYDLHGGIHLFLAGRSRAPATLLMALENDRYHTADGRARGRRRQIASRHGYHPAGSTRSR